MTDEEPRSVYPKACPSCATHFEEELDSIEHGQTRDANLEFRWECPECEHEFTTVSKNDRDPDLDHTLMWVQDEDTGDVTQVIAIEGDDESFGVKGKRAELNMFTGHNYEVQGRPWAIEQLYELFVDTFELPDEEEGELEFAWLPDED